VDGHAKNEAYLSLNPQVNVRGTNRRRILDSMGHSKIIDSTFTDKNPEK
jgi:hypothetical protein